MLNLPTVYYTNVDRKTDRKEYMESQFKSMGIPYERINMPSFPRQVPQDFLNRLDGNYGPSTSHWINLYGSQLFEFMDEWMRTTDDPYLLLMEDDYDLSLLPKCQFDWDEFIDRLPYDWDSIQLGFETPNIIPFYLHPTQPEYSLGASLLHRSYVDKLVSLHYRNDKFKFDYTIANAIYLNRESGIHDDKDYSNTSGGPDYYINQAGKSYSIPIIPINPYLPGISHQGPYGELQWEPKLSFVKCIEAYHDWWRNDCEKYSLDEFFTYGKDNDTLMQRDISKWSDKYFFKEANKVGNAYHENPVYVPTTTRNYN